MDNTQKSHIHFIILFAIRRVIVKKKQWIVMWQIAFTYIGTLIGAGFASGQEILKFFSVYGLNGIYGTVLTGILFAVIGAIVIYTASVLQIENYMEYLTYLFGSRFACVADWIISMFLFFGLAIMLVASGSLFSELWGISSYWGFVLTAGILFCILILGVQGILWLNTCLVPILIIVCMGIALLGIKSSQGQVYPLTGNSNIMGNNWLLATFLYVSYNLVLGTVILSALGKTAYKSGVGGAVIGGVILGLMALVMCLAISFQGELILGNALPMLLLAIYLNSYLGKLYSLILWLAILTTALSNSFGILKRLEIRFLWPRPILALIILFPTVFFMNWPFVRAVEVIYPLLGYVGFILLIAIVIKIPLKNMF